MKLFYQAQIYTLIVIGTLGSLASQAAPPFLPQASTVTAQADFELPGDLPAPSTPSTSSRQRPVSSPSSVPAQPTPPNLPKPPQKPNLPTSPAPQETSTVPLLPVSSPRPIPQSFEDVEDDEVRPALGCLVIDDKGNLLDSRQMSQFFPARPDFINCHLDLLNPTLTASLSDQQKYALLSCPEALLSSRYASRLLRPSKLLLVNIGKKTWRGTLIDMATMTRTQLTEEKASSPQSAGQSLVKQAENGSPSHLEPVVINSESSLYHRPNADHLSHKVRPYSYPDRQLAKREGYTVCPLCFPETNAYLNSSRQDRSYSDEAAQAVEQRYRISQDDQGRARLQACADKVLAANGLEERGYRFVLLSSDEMNAFAVPHTPVYVTDGLMKVLENDDELGTVIAHELAHVIRQHGVKQRTKNRLGSIVGGILTYTTGSPWARWGARQANSFAGKSFSRSDELQADHDAVIMSFIAGYDPQEFINTLNKLEAFAKQTGNRSLVTWFSSHPSEAQRRDRVNKMVTSLKPLQAQATWAEEHGDHSLNLGLRRQVESYLSNSQPLTNFMSVYRQLPLQQKTSGSPN